MESEGNQVNSRENATPFILKEKIADMMKYGKKAVAYFPRRERQTADEIRKSMLTMYRLAIVVEKKYYKKTTLQDLDVELDVLRHLIRLAHDKDFYDKEVTKKDSNGKAVRNENGSVVSIKMQPPLSMQKYETWSKMLNEIGRIIGGYMKYVK